MEKKKKKHAGFFRLDNDLQKVGFTNLYMIGIDWVCWKMGYSPKNGCLEKINREEHGDQSLDDHNHQSILGSWDPGMLCRMPL